MSPKLSSALGETLVNGSQNPIATLPSVVKVPLLPPSSLPIDKSSMNQVIDAAPPVPPVGSTCSFTVCQAKPTLPAAVVPSCEVMPPGFPAPWKGRVATFTPGNFVV